MWKARWGGDGRVPIHAERVPRPFVLPGLHTSCTAQSEGQSSEAPEQSPSHSLISLRDAPT